jgi:predicted RNA-binding protein associated with RNAse of E/G family
LPPQREDDGWSYVDLELDPIRHESGLIEIQDRDEFEDACQKGWITAEDAKVANATAEAMEVWLSRQDEPLAQEGWKRLSALKGRTSG